MMKANYHTHTWRCNHAEPDERAYVQAALDTGLKVLGFSDHSPDPFDDGYCSGFRMRCDQTAEYIRTIAALRDEYRGDIDIHIGFEAEYYPRYFGRLLEMLEPTEYEYLILGQHFLGNELDSQPNFEETDDPARLHQYTDQCMEALNTGAFSCFAHPDVMHFVGDERCTAQSRGGCAARQRRAACRWRSTCWEWDCTATTRARRSGRKRRRSAMRSSSAGTRTGATGCGRPSRKPQARR